MRASSSIRNALAISAGVVSMHQMGVCAHHQSCRFFGNGPVQLEFVHPSESSFQKCHCLSLGSFIRLFVSHEAFDLVSEEAADRCLTTGSENLGLLECLFTQLMVSFLFASCVSHNPFLLHVIYVSHVFTVKLNCPAS